jgi:Zn finger protein HypA/HybF involved in hydrogenase expression
MSWILPTILDDKPIKCVQCSWTGIEADAERGVCPDCDNEIELTSPETAKLNQVNTMTYP